MEALERYFSLLKSFDAGNGVAIDRNHGLFLFGALVARKPEDVLELGIGSGLVSWTLVHGLRYNGRGRLTSVDNWLDWKGQEPPVAEELRKAGVNVVSPVAEEEFVKGSPSDAYDFLVSDADHRRSGSWIDEHLRVTRHDAFLFFHDTNHEDRFRGLKAVERRIRELQLPCFHFTRSTRPEERCERGWLFAINKKDQDTLDRAAATRGFFRRLAGRIGR